MNDFVTDARNRKSVVVYDGECRFCRRWVARIARRDANGAFEFVPRHAEGLVDRFPRLGEAEFSTGVRLITPDGDIHVGADAAHQIVRRLPYVRRVAWLYRVPVLHSLTRAAYGWIAANRQRLSGQCADGTCSSE
ncbi:MAG: DUF393 domain-containing protein [Phycisphaerae bacterium]|jgi:predicted DCC family thiol-disulfide oxidoreductase YuxK